MEIVTHGCVIGYLDNLDATSKAALPAEDYSGSAYVKLSLSFNISGNISGAGTVGVLGISGNAKASAGASFVFAHKVKGSMPLKDAISESLNNFVFPFEPSCAEQIAPGDLVQVTFNGCMSYGLSLTYGIDSYSFSAPSVQTVLDSCNKGGASLTLPSARVDIGASASLGLTHSDDFTAIVQKLDAGHAFLYLMRARKTDFRAGAQIGAEITVTELPQLSVDQQALQAGVDLITRGKGGKKVALLHSDLETKLDNKLTGWVNNVVQNGAGLKAAWDAQSNAMLISKYGIALGNSTVLDHSWDYFCAGNIRSAVGAGGLVLQPGSGVSNSINRSFSISLTFFNFFNAQDVSSYFQKSEAYITDNGNVRFLFDVGKESDSTVNKVLQKARIHFIADATANSPVEVKLQFELSETGRGNEARHMAAIPGYLGASSEASAVATEMRQFAENHPGGTLNLNCMLDSSAYGKLACSPYTGNKPPENQAVDQHNWQVFHDATVSLLDLDYALSVNYAKWKAWNEASNGAPVADRRHTGDPAAGSIVWSGQPSDLQLKLGYFCLATSDFMNLCDDLQQLAQFVNAAKIPDDWNRLLGDLKEIVTRDVNTDFAKPAIAALLKLCTPQTVTYDKQVCGNALTYTIELK
jgi:hypothetical protein